MPLDVLRSWSTRRWLTAAVATLASVVAVAVPTAMVPTPVFGRSVAVTWWSWPVLLVTAALAGLLAATYVRLGEATSDAGSDRPARWGAAGGVLTFFAVGCPVCNKLVLIALGASGALQWFAPIQPVLAGAGVVLLVWALRVRLDGERGCPVPPSQSTG
jgi:hypothetical protein